MDKSSVLRRGPEGGLLQTGVQLILFCAGSLLLFYQNLGRTFAADDFEVIRRVVEERRFLIPGFFRPLSDLSLYGNYLIGGLSPAGYYLFNVLVHGVNCFLLYRLCLRWGPGSPDARGPFAFFAAFFFLVYPFHSEGIDWILGRGASLCTLSGLAALLVMVSRLSIRWRLFWAALFYFVGMAAYEPVILLPLYGLMVVRGRIERRWWLVVMGGVLLVHLAVRVWLSGSVAGEYGGAFFGAGMGRLAGNVIKVAGRLFLPPSEHGRWMAGLFVVVVIGLVVVWMVFVRRWEGSRGRFLKGLILMLAVSCVFPVFTAVSTRTSESDRMLYFPSVFFCCILAYLLVGLVRAGVWRIGVAGLLVVLMVVFLERTGRNWVRASAITRQVLTEAGGPGRCFVINLPDEVGGAFVFRSGFPDAYALMYPGRPAPVVVSHFTRMGGAEYTVGRVGVDSLVVRSAGGSWVAGPGDRVIYWDGAKMALFR